MASAWILLVTVGLQIFTGSTCTAYEVPVFCGAEFALKHVFLLVTPPAELPHITTYLSTIRSATMVRNPDDEGLLHVISDPEDKEAIYRHMVERNMYVSHTPYCVQRAEFAALQARQANQTLFERLRGDGVLGNLIDRAPAMDDEQQTSTKEQNGAMIRLLNNGRLPSFSRRFIRAANATDGATNGKAAEDDSHIMHVARQQGMPSTEGAPRAKREDNAGSTTPYAIMDETEGVGPTLTPEPPLPPPPPVAIRSYNKQARRQGGQQDGVRNSDAGGKPQRSQVRGSQRRTTEPIPLRARGKGFSREDGKHKGDGHRHNDAHYEDEDTDPSVEEDAWVARCIADAPRIDHHLSRHLYKMYKHAKKLENPKGRD